MRVKACAYFLKLHKKIAYFRHLLPNTLLMRAFFMRGNFKPCQSVLCARKKLEKRVFLRASKIWRGFLSQAFQNVGEKKASKTFIFQFEKSEEKKTYAL